MENNSKVANIIFRMDAEDKENFKLACSKSGFPMSEVIRNFIDAFCKQYNITSKTKEVEHE